MRMRWLGTVIVAALFSGLPAPAAQIDSRDRDHQPEKVMDIAGVRAGMTIGEVGAGEGYFTFKLAARVGNGGKVYANDIDARALRSLQAQARKNGVGNIETIIGRVEDPLLPVGALDMVFMVNVFHDLARPVELLHNLAPSLKSGATVVILDRDPEKLPSASRHNLPTETILALIKEADFELVRMETFFRHHNLYIIRPLKRGSPPLMPLNLSTGYSGSNRWSLHGSTMALKAVNCAAAKRLILSMPILFRTLPLGTRQSISECLGILAAGRAALV